MTHHRTSCERILGTNLIWSKKHRLWRAVVAEYVATAAFVFAACASVVTQVVGGSSSVAHNLVAGVVQGFAIGALVYAVAMTSGGHINPAVTFGLAVSGDLPVLHAISYMVAQIVGGISGAALFSGVMPDQIEGNLGTTTLSNGISPFQGFIFEAVVTFVLMFVIFGTAVDIDDEDDVIKPLAPIPIGFSVSVGVTIAYNFTGGSLNPARSLGPAIISHTWDHQWVYWAGPFVGAFVASMFHCFVLRTKPKDGEGAQSSKKAVSGQNAPLGSTEPERMEEGQENPRRGSIREDIESGRAKK